MSRKKKIMLRVTIAVVVAIISVTAFLVYDNMQRDCQDIIGDGYVMGTDPEPVVIGSTCGSDYVPY